jgi:hypothetical protein
MGREYQPFQLGTPENFEEGVAEGLKDLEAVKDSMVLEAAEELRHQEQIQTKEVQDVEEDVSDKEDDVNVDG